MQKKNSYTSGGGGGDFGVFTSILIFIFVASLMGTTGYLYWKKEKLTSHYVSELKMLNRKNVDLKDAINKERKEKERRELALEELQGKYEQMEIDFVQVKKDLDEARNVKELLTKKFDDFGSKTVDNWKKIEDMVQNLNKEIESLNVLATSFDTKNMIAKTDSSVEAISKEKESIELPAVIVKERKSDRQTSESRRKKKIEEKVDVVATQLTDSAQIMSVNKEHNFVVINKGLVDGIKVGDRYLYESEGDINAEIAISEIRDFVSLGLIDEMKAGTTLKKGDKLFKDN